MDCRSNIFAIVLLLGGCTMGPSYTAPVVAVPLVYGSPHSAEPGDEDIARWWSAFDDPVLDNLIERARRGNLDVRQAAARVEQARAQERATRAAGAPSLNASAQGGYTRLSENSLPSALANIGNLDGDPSDGPGIGLPGEGFTTFQAGFDASWEIDLFGGQRRAREAARARTDASLWSQRDAEVMLAAEVANNYQQYRALRRRIALADERIAAQREMLDFVAVRSRQGLTTTLDKRAAERELEQEAAARADMAAQASARVHALGILLGLAPTTLLQELAERSAPPQEIIAVPAGLPSQLLQRRPDLRAAERRLAAATADIGVATADLYPKFSLTGALQLASRSLTSLFEADSLLANGAGRFSLPILGSGASRATVQLREAQAEEALLAYQAEILGALHDVEDALVRLDADKARVGHLRASERAARDAVDTTEVRFRNGLITYLEVIAARQNWLTAQDALASMEAAAAQDVVALYKALGGGWDERRVEQQQDE